MNHIVNLLKNIFFLCITMFDYDSSLQIISDVLKRPIEMGEAANKFCNCSIALKSNKKW